MNRAFVIRMLQVVLAVVLVQSVYAGWLLLRPERTPRHPIGIPNPPVGVELFFAPVGNYQRADAEALASHYREKFRLDIGVLPTVHVPAEAVDRRRDQLIAEALIDALSRTDVATEDPRAVVIGLTNADMYIAGKDWSYAYSLRRFDRFAIVSTARMGDGLFVDDARRLRRLHKMVTKNVGILYYHLPPSDDPGSVLYSDILGPSDLDRVSEDF